MRTVLSFLATSIAVSHAAEITVESKPLVIERGFSAMLLPAEPALIAVDPKQWAEFPIDWILPHGSKVKKDDVLVKFDREGIDRKIDDQRRAVKSRALSLAGQELAFAKLREETTLKLEAARRVSRVASEELEYFTKTGRKAQEDDAANDLESAQQRLEATKEELKQLKMMYDADDLTEQTEEIILKRQQYAVKSSELNLRLVELSTRRTLEVLLPRRAETLESEAKSAAIELEKAEKNLPRGLESAEIELEAARTAAAREKADLADLEKDAALMEITASTDGYFYHGSIEDGRWTVGELAKVLVEGGKVPLARPFATVATANAAELGLAAYVDEVTARSLKKQLKGSITAAGREDVVLTATIQEIGSIPGSDGKYLVTLLPEIPGETQLEWPADLDIAPGMNFECRFIVHQKDAAITVPAKALHSAGGGTWTIHVKLADGKNEARPVTRGRADGNQIEILSGLEGGQVVILPD